MIYSKLLGAGVILAAAALPNAAKAADAFVPVSDVWTGAYVGAFGGYAWHNAEGELIEALEHDDLSVDGFLVGGQVGYNHQIDKMVLGIEADLAYSFANNEFDFEGEEADLSNGFLGTLRGRAGMAFGETDSTLVFVTAGLAVADFDFDIETSGDGQTHYGYVLGAGVEQMVTDSVSIKAEYNYMDFGSEDYFESEGGYRADFDGHVVKLGVNFHF